MPKFSRFAILALALATLLIPLSGFAQTSRTTGALIGTVTEPAGTPVPGVTVTVTSPALQGPRVTTTDAKGEYQFPLLPPGTYRAEYTLEGAKKNVRENVVVSLTQTTKVNVQMVFAASETITVTAGSVVIDPTETGTQTNFKAEHLKYGVVGAANRSYQNVLFQAPEANSSSGGGSNPSVSGANVAQNTYLLDGINTTDPVVHTFGNNLAFDAIQEVSIQTLGKDAEYGSSGGTVNVITKSGGNDLSGSFDWRYRDVHFQSQGQATHPTGFAYYGADPTGSARNFNKDLQPVKSSQPAATFGGPLQRDKLWFFAAIARPITERTQPNIYGFQPLTGQFKGWNNLGKLTFTPVANQTITAKFIDSYARIPNVNSYGGSSAYSPEAEATQLQKSRTYGITYDAIVSPKWLANVQLGHTPAALSVTPQTQNAVPVYDLATGISTGAYGNLQARTSKRDELLASTTYYLEAAGTHAIKGGFDVNRTAFTSTNNAFGDPSLIPGYDPSFCSEAYGFPAGTRCAANIQLNPGSAYSGYGDVPQWIVLSPVNAPHTVDSKEYAYFVQDEWNPISRLTVRAGVRYEQVNWQSHSVANPPNFKMFQPRLGVAYDIFNNATSVVHGYVGRIMDDNQLTLPSYGVAQPTGAAYFDLDPSTGKYTYDTNFSAVYPTGEIYDRNLKPSYSNQLSVGFTQKIWRNTSIDITGEYRKQKNLFEDYCGYIANGSVTYLPQCIITNNPGADQGAVDPLRMDYHAIVTKIESRPWSWLDFIASWNHSTSKGSIGSSYGETQNATAFFDVYPVHFTNTYGYLSQDARNRVKIDGYVHLPLDFTVGTNFYWDDGTPWSVYQNSSRTSVTNVLLPYGSYFIEPRGSRRLPNYSQLDLQVQKDFRVGPTKLGLIASVYNVLNSETVTGINGNAGSRGVIDPATGRLLVITDPNYNNTGKPYQVVGPNRLNPLFGQPTSWQQPRRYEAGVRVEF